MMRWKKLSEKRRGRNEQSEFVDAPLIDELPLAMECKVKSFEGGILVGEIVNVSADVQIWMMMSLQSSIQTSVLR